MNSSNKAPLIQVNNLTKIFDKYAAVNNLTLNINQGEIFGFLGPNGAGKTTTIKAMLGLIYANQGDVRINGYDILTHGKSLKKYIGYLPERVAFYENLSGLQNLEFYAELKNVNKSECKILIDQMGLSEHINKKAGKYSKGMRQRLGMARAILGTPPILILDEPSGGLDPRGVKLIRDKIKELNDRGVTIFVSSHILSEIQAVCSQVGIINKGKLIVQDTVDNLGKTSRIKPKIKLEFSFFTDEIKKEIISTPGVEKVIVDGNTLEIYCLPEVRADVIIAAYKAGGKIKNIQTEEASLEDIFMQLTEGEKL